MKRLATFTLAALLCCLMTGAAQAETIPDAARSILLYPNEVTEYEQDGHPRISKVYILSEQDNPAAQTAQAANAETPDKAQARRDILNLLAQHRITAAEAASRLRGL